MENKRDVLTTPTRYEESVDFIKANIKRCKIEIERFKTMNGLEGAVEIMTEELENYNQTLSILKSFKEIAKDISGVINE